MNITFILGNGFDISFGLDSSYKSFYEWYLLQPSKTQAIKNFKYSIKNEPVETWADFEKGLGEYSKKFSLETIEDFYECYQDAHYKLMEYLKEQEKDVDISSDDLEIFSQSLLNFYQELIPVESELFQSMINGVTYDIEYNIISLNYTRVIDNFKENVKIPLKAWNAGGSGRRAFIKALVHAHGYSDKWPILAVDNVSQLNEQLLTDPNFQSLMIKSDAVSVTGENWTDKSKSMINSSNIICLFGVSIGETDTRWWKHICEWLKNTNHRLVVFWYDNKMTNDNISLLQKMRNERSVKNKILEYAHENDKDNLSSRIHVIINTDSVFSFNKSYTI